MGHMMKITLPPVPDGTERVLLMGSPIDGFPLIPIADIAIAPPPRTCEKCGNGMVKIDNTAFRFEYADIHEINECRVCEYRLFSLTAKSPQPAGELTQKDVNDLNRAINIWNREPLTAPSLHTAAPEPPQHP